MKLRTYTSNKYLGAALVLTLSAVAGIVINTSAHATMSKVNVRFDRMAISQPTTGTVCATANTAGTVSSVTVTFPTGFTVSTTAGNWTTSTTNLAWPTGGTAWPTLSSPSISGQAVTWTSGTLTTGTLYCFNWTNSAALTQPSSTGTSETGTVATNIENGNAAGQYSTATVGTNADQIQVTASVPASFSFSLSQNADTIQNLSSTSVGTSTTPSVATIATNAKNGWNVWARDTNGKLTSAVNSYNISTNPGVNSTLSAGTEGYNVGITSSNSGGNGTLTVATPYVGGSTGKGGGLDASLRLLASSTGQATGSTLTLTNNVAISAITPAASDYTDTITVVGAGLF